MDVGDDDGCSDTAKVGVLTGDELGLSLGTAVVADGTFVGGRETVTFVGDFVGTCVGAFVTLI